MRMEIYVYIVYNIDTGRCQNNNNFFEVIDMKHMFVEDSYDRVWCRVIYVNKRGVPMFDDDQNVALSDDDIQRCVDWCERTGHNWMVSEVLH